MPLDAEQHPDAEDMKGASHTVGHNEEGEEGDDDSHLSYHHDRHEEGQSMVRQDMASACGDDDGNEAVDARTSFLGIRMVEVLRMVAVLHLYSWERAFFQSCWEGREIALVVAVACR